ncbi:MAG: ribbon-helix-helix protein, CopG family [Deltaproteobacteria bacterium]|nr:ribbon-helix-helix protein, CopG family [Deltaproteobacteria bacterium]
MRETITISIPAAIRRKLDGLVRKEHMNRSDIVREALRQYFARRDFERLRGELVPEAEARGLFTDEDVFKRVS